MNLFMDERPISITLMRLGTVATLLLAAFIVWTDHDSQWAFAKPEFPKSNGSAPVFKTVLNYEFANGVAHAPAILRENDGSVRIVWFEGSFEGANDINIVGMRLNFKEGEWITEAEKTTILTPGMVSKAIEPMQSVLTLGNTVQFDTRQAGSMLATISIGGWSVASTAHLEGVRGGMVEKGNRLNLSPFLNRSHLARSPTILMENGDIGVPLYFEMGNTMSEFVRMTPEGRIVARSRITQGRPGIQPLVVPFDRLNAVALMRNNNGANRLVASWTDDGGNSWTNPKLLDVPNRDAPVAAIALSENTVLMVHNPSQDDTYSIALSVSDDRGHSWREIVLLEHPGTIPITAMRTLRYPMMVKIDDSHILLTYSFGSKSGIRAHIFNAAWLIGR